MNKKESINSILNDIITERQRQDVIHGIDNKNPMEWLAILMEENGEVAECVLDLKFNKRQGKKKTNLREEIIQVAATAVAFVECLDRNEWKW
jgi:NTP pyrophosphatase (non-canonical NTP hydrolase)